MRAIMILTTVTILTTACGGGGGGSGSNSSQSTKGVFSKWSSGSKTIDLSSGQFGTPFALAWVYDTGAICESEMEFSGDNSSGIWVDTNAVYAGGGSGDPGCSAINGGGTYTNDGTTMTACRGSATCTTFN